MSPPSVLLRATVEQPVLGQGPDLTRYLLVCAGLIAIIPLLALGFRKLLAQRLIGRAAARSLRVIDVLPLGPKRQLSVVRCYDRTFVLGLGEKEVNLIAELDLDRESEAVVAQPSLPDSADFARLLDKARQRMAAARKSESATTSASHRPSLKEVVG